MSAFAVVYERSNTLVETGMLDKIMLRLDHRGPDGKDDCLAGNITLGHWHFWTTPEEIGEKQPLELPGYPFKVVLDGRLDNRPELIAELGLHSVEGCRFSDAALILHSYDRWGESCFEHFIGAFAMVIWDERRGELLCARDALGDRTLFYHISSTRMLVASEPWAVAGAMDPDSELDEAGITHYFALKAPEDGRTFFKDIYELLPAQVMGVNISSERRWQYWQADLSAKVRYRSDEEYAEHFCSLLEQSVRCRLRTFSSAGILMSGGLDSTSVACLAARMLAPTELTTFSYIFDELPDCDERQYINAIQNRWALRSIQLTCDDLWPLKNWSLWPYNPNKPVGNPYRLLKERTYQCAKDEGVRVLLTGGFGDSLYSGAEGWLADLLAECRLKEAAEELAFHIRSYGLRWNLQAGYLQNAVRRCISAVSGKKRMKHKQPMPPWLTPYATSILYECESGPSSVSGYQSSLVGLWGALSCSSEIFNASRYAIELRHPYRDRRLIEFALALPAHQLYCHGFYKHILRNAMNGLLPEVIRTRPRSTSLETLFFRGLEREETILRTCFESPQAAWHKFIDEKWISSRWNVIPFKDGSESLIPWLCIAYEAWQKHFVS